MGEEKTAGQKVWKNMEDFLTKCDKELGRYNQKRGDQFESRDEKWSIKKSREILIY